MKSLLLLVLLQRMWARTVLENTSAVTVQARLLLAGGSALTVTPDAFLPQGASAIPMNGNEDCNRSQLLRVGGKIQNVGHDIIN